MGAARNFIDKKVLRDFIPLNALSALHLDEISKKALIEDVPSGRYIFKCGDNDNNSVYLLEGTIELLNSSREVVDTIVADSDTARHPLVHKQPRQLSARASGTVTVARIDSSLLDVLLTWDESAGYDVVEIDAEDDDDWMTRMLQSQTFLQLPPSNIHQLLMRLESVSVTAGEVIVTQGEEGEYFYIVKSGRLAVTRKVSARSKEVLLAELSEGTCFGEEALVAGSKRNASVMMVTDGTLMRLSKDDFNQLLREPLVHEIKYEKAKELVTGGARWLDVRLPGEFENQSIKGSQNYPLSALRDQIISLDTGATYILCCDTGRRSSAGAFVLSQRGFNVYYLSSGLKEVPDEELTTPHTSSHATVRGEQESGIIRLDTEQGIQTDDEPAAGHSVPGENRGSVEPIDQALKDEVRMLRDAVKSRDLDIRELGQQLEEAQMVAGASADTDHEELQQALRRARQELETLKSQQDGDSEKTDSSLPELTEQLEEQGASLAASEIRVKALEQQITEQVALADALQQELELGSTDLEQARLDNARVEQQLQEREQAIEEAKKLESALRQELDEKDRKNSELVSKLTEHDDETSQQSSERKEKLEDSERKLAEQVNTVEMLQQQLDSMQQKARETEDRADTLEKKLSSIQKEHKSEISSVHDAMARVQTERENVFREQDRLTKELHKVKRELVHEQNDHKDTVHRMRKELEAASIEDNSALADELKEVQKQYRQEQEERSALEQQLQVRAEETSVLQETLEAANEQLEHARETADQVEQHHNEAMQSVSEELNARLAGEQQVQQTLREEIAAVVSQRDQKQEQLTVMDQELVDLRTEAEKFRQERAENARLVQSLEEQEKNQESCIHEHRQQLLQLEQDLDEVRQAELRAREEIDQYRAEAEITRGLADVNALSGDTVPQLRQELEQIKKNVDVAVRLRNQAEEELAETRQELQQLRTEMAVLQHADEFDMDPSDIPSLDEDDPYESILSTGDQDADAQAIKQESTPRILLDDDEVSGSVHCDAASPVTRGGRMLGASLFLLLVIAAVGAFWWYGQNGGTQFQSDFLSSVIKEADTVSQKVAPDEPEVVEQVELKPEKLADSSPLAPRARFTGRKESGELRAVSGERQEPAVEPFSMAKGMPVDISGYRGTGPAEIGVRPAVLSEEESTEPLAPAETPEIQVMQQPARRFNDVLSDGGVAPGMVQLRADRFVMGSGSASPNFDERPEHTVQLASYAISQYEVTFDDYDRFARATGRSLPYDEGWGRGRRPVINVSKQSAEAYSRWLSQQTGHSYRLPTEAEWEYAARSGSSRHYAWGGELQENMANCYDCGSLSADSNTRPVGSYAANSYGLHDMAGNVREWTQDCYRAGYQGAPTGGQAVTTAGCSEYSVRGGSFSSPADKLRSASRDRAPADSRLDDLGFRVVRD